MWMGGTLPLGYDRPVDLTTRASVVNAAEAANVQLMFTSYLELGSVHARERWLAACAISSKGRTTRRRVTGGVPFSRGAALWPSVPSHDCSTEAGSET